MFIDFKLAIEKKLGAMDKGAIFVVDMDKDELWDTYLSSFPEGTNPIYRERTEHDCQCCKQFIRTVGAVVVLDDLKPVSVWDIDIGGFYGVVARAMAEKVKSKPIKDVFRWESAQIGTSNNRQMLEDGSVKTWNHFSGSCPNHFTRKHSIASTIAPFRNASTVFRRALEEITTEAVELVLELIDQNSLYRGEEHKASVKAFLAHKHYFKSLESEELRHNYCWLASVARMSETHIRNSVIGTLLVDISQGRELDSAVSSFEQKVAPANYRRPTAIVTQAMVKKAQVVIEGLGLEPSLHRRYAVPTDITIENLIFADRSAKKSMNVFDELATPKAVTPSSLKRVEEMPIASFIENVVPKAESIELLLENRMEANMVSLIAPAHKDAKSLFRWDNGFSWAYKGDVADSIKEKVKAAGGTVEGFLRASLSWFNYDDLDLHAAEPNGTHIYYGNRVSRSSGQLDVDMNAGSGTSRSPVENIIWSDPRSMPAGTYDIAVKNFCKRENSDVGFDVEIEFGGQVFAFSHDKPVSDNEVIKVASISFDGSSLTMKSDLPSSARTRNVWGLDTQQFHKVRMLMNSPNHWDENATGNRHWFLMLENCINDQDARGFFNEYLHPSLSEHRKVFEVLGSKLKAPSKPDQLSGVGFSSTKPDSVYLRVTGSFTRTIKVTI